MTRKFRTEPATPAELQVLRAKLWRNSWRHFGIFERAERLLDTWALHGHDPRSHVQACGACEGTGKRWTNSGPGPGRWVAHYETCFQCNGTGRDERKKL